MAHQSLVACACARARPQSAGRLLPQPSLARVLGLLSMAWFRGAELLASFFFASLYSFRFVVLQSFSFQIFRLRREVVLVASRVRDDTAKTKSIPLPLPHVGWYLCRAGA